MEYCSTFLVYDDVHYYIPSTGNFQNEKINKHADALEKRQISEETDI